MQLFLYHLLHNIISKHKYHQGNQYYKTDYLGPFQEFVAQGFAFYHFNNQKQSMAAIKGWYGQQIG